MTLQDFIRALRRGWWIVTVGVLIGLLGALAAALLQTPTYQSTAVVFVSTTAQQTPDQRQADNQFALSRASSYAALATTNEVLQSAAARLPGTSASDLQGRVTSNVTDATNLVNLTVTGSTSVRAADAANAVADALAREVNAIESAGQDSTSEVVLRVVQTATPSGSPTAPNPVNTLVIGFIVGLAIGIAVAIILQAASGLLRSPRDVAVVSGLVPTSIPESASGPVARERRQEAYRSLRSNLRFGLGTRGVILIAPVVLGTSARDSAFELARTFGEVGARTLLVDADLRTTESRKGRARARRAEQAGTAGLTDTLLGTAAFDDVVQPGGDDGTWVMGIGTMSDAGVRAVSGEAMSALLSRASKDYDYVIVLSPPMLERSESAVLAAQARTSVLCFGARGTKRNDLLFALERLQAVGVSSISLLLDNVARADMLPARIRTPDAHLIDHPAEPQQGRNPFSAE